MPLPSGPLAVKPGRAPVVAPAAVIVPGSAEYVPFVRHWVTALAARAGGPGGELEFAVAELLANAVTHTRSGHAGGQVTVIVAAGPGEAVLHVHDLGSHNGQVPHMK